jgi:hypothetical protein
LPRPTACSPSTTAFDISHVISAVVFASTAIPVFLPARLVTRDRAAAVLAAALSIAVPWIAMTATLMTEPIAHAASAWALLAMTRALERPPGQRDLLALLAIVLAALARTQLAILGAAFVATAVTLFLIPTDGARPRPAMVRAHWPLAVAAVVGTRRDRLTEPPERPARQLRGPGRGPVAAARYLGRRAGAAGLRGRGRRRDPACTGRCQDRADARGTGKFHARPRLSRRWRCASAFYSWW